MHDYTIINITNSLLNQTKVKIVCSIWQLAIHSCGNSVRKSVSSIVRKSISKLVVNSVNIDGVKSKLNNEYYSQSLKNDVLEELLK